KCPVDLGDGYSFLLRLHFQPAVFAAAKGRIPGLVDRIKALEINTYEVYNAHVNAGFAFEQNGELDAAHHWYQQAIALAPEMVSAYISEAYLYMNQGHIDRASEYFQRVIKVAPESSDGYWGMSWVSEDRGDLEAALRWCRECSFRLPEWVTYAHVRLGTLQR